MADRLKKVRFAKVADKRMKQKNKQKAALAEEREKKQVSWYLLPDAPPAKNHKRKASPERVPCPLLPGVPVTPPPRKIQPWGRKKRLPEPCCETDDPKPSSSSGPSRFIFDDESLPDPCCETGDPQPSCSSEMSIFIIDEASNDPCCETGDPQPSCSSEPSIFIIDEASNNDPCCETGDPQPSCLSEPSIFIVDEAFNDPCCETGDPQPSCSSEPSIFIIDEAFNDSRKIQTPFTISPSTDNISGENLVVEGEIKDSFSPPSSIGPGCVERSTSLPDGEYYIFDDDEFFAMPVDPGSDVEENISLDQSVEVGSSGGGMWNDAIIIEVLPPHLARMLTDMDTRDDSALREVVSSQDMLHFDWSNNPDKFVGQQEQFTGAAGPTFSLDGLSPLDVFQRIWDADIIEMIVRESNRYGEHLYSSSKKLWVQLNATDIWVFLAVLMFQSILILPVEKEYWYPCLGLLKVGDFNKIMPFRKFLRIKKCMHFVDNTILTTATGENRKLKKIWPIIEHLNNKFSSLYLPEQYIAIDESLLLWKGRLSFVQLIATKAARVGIKSYELCESRTGYLWKMLLYTGRSDQSQPDAETSDEPEGATSKIVYNLVRPLLNKGHTLVMDNFYNSPLLSRTLKSKQTDTIGTLRLNRAYVPESVRHLSKSNTRAGEVVYSQTEDISICVWHDSNMVAMISTYHKAAVGGKEKFGTFKYKPQVVLDYNMTMGGVDKKDQMLKAFPVERVRNLVWYKKLFRRLLNVSIYNAFVMFNHDKSGNQRQFRVALAREILEKMQVQIPELRKEIRTNHFPAKSDAKRARCRLCYIKKMQTRTSYKCDTCNINLCIIGCFREYHLMQKD